MKYKIDYLDSESGDITYSTFCEEEELEGIKDEILVQEGGEWETCTNEEQPDLLWQMEGLDHFIHIRKV